MATQVKKSPDAMETSGKTPASPGSGGKSLTDPSPLVASSASASGFDPASPEGVGLDPSGDRSDEASGPSLARWLGPHPPAVATKKVH
jgi:hypothetical protein